MWWSTSINCINRSNLSWDSSTSLRKTRRKSSWPTIDPASLKPCCRLFSKKAKQLHQDEICLNKARLVFFCLVTSMTRGYRTVRYGDLFNWWFCQKPVELGWIQNGFLTAWIRGRCAWMLIFHSTFQWEYRIVPPERKGLVSQKKRHGVVGRPTVDIIFWKSVQVPNPVSGFALRRACHSQD